LSFWFRTSTKRALVDGDSESFPLEKAAASRSEQVSGRCRHIAGPGITVSSVNVTNGTTLTAQLTVTGSAALGPRSITVTTGSEEATLPNGFRVL
jgi:hypothetical protein